MRDSKSRYYSDLELVGTFEKIAADEFFEVPYNTFALVRESLFQFISFPYFVFPL